MNLYPMYANNRRCERRTDILDVLVSQHNFIIKSVIDYSYFERDNKFRRNW